MAETGQMVSVYSGTIPYHANFFQAKFAQPIEGATIILF